MDIWRRDDADDGAMRRLGAGQDTHRNEGAPAKKKGGPGASFKSGILPGDSSCGMAPAEAGWMQANCPRKLMQQVK